MFCSKMHNFDLNLKIYTGFIEQAFKHPHVKYLSNQMILKFDINYHIIIYILEF